jgi:hypothetical protein
MAELSDYGLKYQSDFYNYFGKLVSVKIYRLDYALDIIPIRTSEVTITSSYTDDDTPIIGKGAKVVVIADTEDMDYLEDLLLSTERQFLCTIEYNSQPVFRGYTICDVNERQVLPYAAVTLQFTDYLHRTEGQYPNLLGATGGVTQLLQVINELLYATEMEFNLFVNSTLFEDSMTKEASDTWLTQTYAQNVVFFSDAYTVDNLYEAINKALQPFSAFLYSYNNKFVIERQEDITRTGDWVTYGQPVINDLASTARQFVNDHYQYLDTNYDVRLSFSGADIVFYGWLDFSAPTISNLTGDLAGTVNAPTANYSAGVSAIDKLYPIIATGSVILVCKPSVKGTWSYISNAETTCSVFVSTYATQFASSGVILTYDEDSDGWHIQLERSAGPLDTGRIRLSGTFDYTIEHTQLYVLDSWKRQTITLTGTYGTANITVNGSGNRLAGVPAEEDSEAEVDVVIASVTDSLKQELNKQDGDWDYKDCTQIVEYDSGLRTLILNLRDKKLDTLVSNEWPPAENIDIKTVNWPSGDDMEYRTWYADELLTDITTGKDMYEIAQWVHVTNGDTSFPGGRMCGWSYKFAVYPNQEADSPETILSIKFSMAADNLPASACDLALDIVLKIAGGPYDGALMTLGGPVSPSDYGYDSDNVMINIFPTTSLYASLYALKLCRISQLFDVHLGEPKKWDFSLDINMESMPVRIYGAGTTYTQYNNGLWAVLGSPEYQLFIINFLPPRWTSVQRYDPRHADVRDECTVFSEYYLGDISVTVNAEEIANKITYVLNQNFIKTQEFDLHLFDLANMNYGNALLLDESGVDRTQLWSSENSTTSIPLYEILAKCKFRKYGRTIHRLKGTILSDNILKPFALLTDDTITNEFSGVITFLLNGFTWDLVNGIYDIDAEEYTEDTVVVDGVTYDSEGEIIYPTPTTPVWSSCWMETSGDRHPIHLSWEPVEGGMIEYRVEQEPWYMPPMLGMGDRWVNTWKQVWHGTDTHCVIQQNASATDPGETLHFRVCAYNPTAQSGWSTYKNFNWEP